MTNLIHCPNSSSHSDSKYYLILTSAQLYKLFKYNFVKKSYQQSVLSLLLLATAVLQIASSAWKRDLPKRIDNLLQHWYLNNKGYFVKRLSTNKDPHHFDLYSANFQFSFSKLFQNPLNFSSLKKCLSLLYASVETGHWSMSFYINKHFRSSGTEIKICDSWIPPFHLHLLTDGISDDFDDLQFTKKKQNFAHGGRLNIIPRKSSFVRHCIAFVSVS